MTTQTKTKAAPAPAAAAAKAVPAAATKAVPAKTVTKSVEPEPAVAVAAVTAPVEVDVNEDMTVKFTNLAEKLALITSTVKDVQNVLKVLQKEYTKLSKTASKKAARGAKTGQKRSPSGFAKPTGLSNELCDFLSIPHGSQKARTEVTRMLNEYIKKNNLQDSNDKRQIQPDAHLKKLMKMKDGDKLTYFNLQTYIKHHFIKTV